MRLSTRALECVDVSQQIALRGLLPWVLVAAIAVGSLRGSMALDTSATLGVAAAGLQLLGRVRRAPEDRDDDR